MFLRERQRQRSFNWAPGGISWSDNALGSPAGPLQVRHGAFKKVNLQAREVHLLDVELMIAFFCILKKHKISTTQKFCDK